jgi:PAS domain S-box-containing protein
MGSPCALEEAYAMVMHTRAPAHSNQSPVEIQASLDEAELLQLLVANLREYAIIMLDPMGYVLTWSSAAEQLKGWKSEEIIGQHLSRFYPAEEVLQGKVESELRIATQEGRFEEQGWRVRKDGTHFWANVSITCLRTGDGKVRGFGEVTRDLTERHLAEQLKERLFNEMRERERTAIDLRFGQKLESIGRLAAGMAHEINTPSATV